MRDYGQDPAKYLQAKALEFASASDTAQDDKRGFVLAWKRLMLAATAYARRRQKVASTAKTPE